MSKDKNTKDNNPPELPTNKQTAGGIAMIVLLLIVLLQTTLVILKLAGTPPFSSIAWGWLFLPTYLGFGSYAIFIIVSLLVIHSSVKKFKQASKDQLHDLLQAKLIHQEIINSMTSAVSQYLSEQGEIFKNSNNDFLDQLALQLNSIPWNAIINGGDPDGDPVEIPSRANSESGPISHSPFEDLNSQPIATSVFNIRKDFRNALLSHERAYTTIVKTDKEGIETTNFWLKNAFKDSPIIPEVTMKAVSHHIWAFGASQNPNYKDTNGNVLPPITDLPSPKNVQIRKGTILIKDGQNLVIVTLEGQNILPETFKTV